MKRLLAILFVLLVTVAGILYFDEGKVYAEEDESMAYAVLTSQGDLIFFRSNESYINKSHGTVTDINGKEYTGTVFTGVEKTPSNYSGIPWYSSRSGIQRVYVTENTTIKPASMSYWFNDARYLESFDGRGFDTSNVTSMSYMFYSCNKLASLDFSNFDTSNVTYMNNMFSSCNSLVSIDASTFDTSNVKDMSYMFSNCNNLTSLDLSSFDTNNVTSMTYMFSNCNNLTSLDLSSFDTNNVTSMACMFSNCNNLTSLDLSSFDTNNVTSMTYMFSNCNNLTSLDLSGFDTSNVTNMSSMFSNCGSLTSLDLSSFDTNNVTDMSDMFRNCSSLVSLDLSGFITNNAIQMYEMFYNCSSLVSLNVDNFDTSNVTSMSGMFSGCSSLKSLVVNGFDTSNVTNMSSMFRNCGSLTSLDLSSFDMSKVSNMSNMFYWCKNLSSIILGPSFSNWKDEAYLPGGGLWVHGKYEKIPEELYIEYSSNVNEYVGEWNKVTSNAIFTEEGDLVFFEASVIYENSTETTINIEGEEYTGIVFSQIGYDSISWGDKTTAIKKVYVAANQAVRLTDAEGMFSGCTNLVSFDGRGFDTRYVTDMSVMFSGCESLTSLDLSSFDTRNVTDMSAMFSACSSLLSLDLSSFKTNEVTNMYLMFSDCDKLSTINLGEGFVKWFDATLPGNCVWVHGDLEKTAVELLEEYPSHASEWAGEWRRVTANAILTNGGDLVFFRSYGIYDNGDETIVTDINGKEFTGTVYTNVEYLNIYNYTSVPWYSNRNAIKRVYVAEGNVIKPKYMSYWFSGATNLSSFDEKGFDTSNVSSMNNLFSACNSLKSLDLSNFNTSNVVTMEYMFSGCSSLISLDLSNFNTSNVTRMSSMFSNCRSLISVDLSSFDTSHVYDMNNMFSECGSLTSLDLSNFDTSNVTDMYYMFSQCSSLISLDFSNFNTSSIRYMYYMFSECRQLAVIQIGEKFTNWANNALLPIGGVWVHGDLEKTAEELCNEYPSHSTEWAGEWRRLTANAILTDDGDFIFFKGVIMCKHGTEATVTDVNGNEYTGIVYPNVENYALFDPDSEFINWDNNREKIKRVYVAEETIIKPTNLYNWFNYSTNLESFDGRGFDTSTITSMASLFSGCDSLKSINVSSFDTSNVTNMNSMFYNCSSLISLDLSNFDTSNVTNMSSMFSDCNKLSTVELGTGFTNWINSAYLPDGGTWVHDDIEKTAEELYNEYPSHATEWAGEWRKKTANAILTNGGDLVFFQSYGIYDNGTETTVTDIKGKEYTGTVYTGVESTVTWSSSYIPWYSVMTSIKKVYVTEESIIKPRNMTNWFVSATNLESFDGNGFDTSNVSNMRYMFNNCSSLKALDLSSFDTSNVSSMTSMFYGCNKLSTVELGEGFTNWIDSAYLPDGGTWVHGNLEKTAEELYNEYPSHASEWAGEWRRVTANAILTDSGDLVFFQGYGIYDNGTETTVTDIKGKEYTGTVYTGVEYPRDEYSSDLPWKSKMSSIKKVYVADGSVIKPKSMFYWFNNATNLESFDGNGFDTSNVFSMKGMFSECSSLTSVDLSSFVKNKVTSMESMFHNCKSLPSLDLSSLYTKDVTNMNYMFYQCSSLTSLKLNSFDTSKVTSMYNIFYNCSSLTSLDLSSFDTSNLDNMGSMFSGCSSLTSLNLSSFDTSKVTSMNDMFHNCSSLTSLDLSSFDTSKVTDMSYMFSGCHYLTTLDISSFDTSNVTEMYSMFRNCYTLKTVKLGPKFTVWEDEAYLPNGTWKKGTTSKTAEQLYTDYPANASSWAGTWERQIVKITGISQNSWDYTDLLYVGETTDPYFSFTPTNATIQVVKLSSNNEKVVKVTGNLNNYTLTAVGEGTAEITAAAIDGSGVKYKYTIRVLADKPYAVLNSKGELVFVRSENTYDYGVEDTVYATNGKQYTGTVFTDFEKSSRYYGNETTWRVNEETYNKIKKVYVADGFTMYPGTMSSWFSGCKNLTSFNVKGFDGSRLTSTSYMFEGCSSLKSLDLSGLDTSKVTSMYDMFSFCSSLTSLKLGNFDTGNVTNMNYMFSNCEALTSLDLSSFSTGKVTDMYGMFNNDSMLKTIYASEGFVVTGLTYQNDMFWGCTSLVGGNGTKFDSSHTGSDYARIDKAGQPGYFTYRSSANIPAPTISSSSMNTNGVTLKWSAVSGADEYVVYRKQGTGSYKEVGRSTTTNYTDGTALAGTKYTYAVKAHNTTTGKYSDYSAEKTLTYNPFKDVKSTSAHYKNIMWAFNKGLVNGTSKTTFSPEGTCMRKSFAIMLWKLNGRPSASGTNPFTDIDGLTSNEKKAIQWCYKNKIVSGMTKTTFAPEGDVTRKAVVIMLWKAAGRPEVVGSDNPFTDISKLSANEKSAILWAYENGITKGTTKTTFGPEENCTREQLCTFLARYNNLLHIMD